MQNKKSGFTLIELLVVIAIIGLLAAVVLASLSGARDKGKDASAQESMTSMRVEMELYATTNGGSYGPGVLGGATVTWSSNGTITLPPSGKGGACNAGKAPNLLQAAAANAGNTATCRVGTGALTWEADIVLRSGNQFCVDSDGFSGQVAAPAHTDITKNVSCK